MEREQYYEELESGRILTEFVDTIYINIREYEEKLFESGLADEIVVDMLDNIKHEIEVAKLAQMKMLDKLKNNSIESDCQIGFTPTQKEEILEDTNISEKIEGELHSNKYNSVAMVIIDGEERYFKLGDINIVDFDDGIDKINP